MRAGRGTIARMMVGIAAVGLGLAALARPNHLAASLVFGATLLGLGIAVIAALYGDAGARARRVGFALGGWLCIILHLFPFALAGSGRVEAAHAAVIAAAPPLPTTALLDALFARTHLVNPYLQNPIRDRTVTHVDGPTPSIMIFPRTPAEAWGDYWLQSDEGMGEAPTPVRSESFLLVGYSMFSWLSAWIGSIAAGRLAASAKTKAPASTST